MPDTCPLHPALPVTSETCPLPLDYSNIFISTSCFRMNMAGGHGCLCFCHLHITLHVGGKLVFLVFVTWQNELSSEKFPCYYWHNIFARDPPVNIHIYHLENLNICLCVCLRSFVWCLHSHTICCGIKRANVKLLTVKNVFSHNKEEYLVKLWLPTFHLSRHRVCILIPFPQCKHPNIVNWS